MYLVDGSIKIVNSWLGGPIVAYCDADGLSSKPSQFLMENYNIQIIAVCPPNGMSENWTETMPGSSHVMKLVTKLWSPRELFTVAMFFNPRDIPWSCLHDVLTYCGPNLRRCLSASLSPTSII